MSGGRPRSMMDYLHRVAGPPRSGSDSDGHLVRRFAGERDGAAFAALVQRHGPMVLGVCRRILRDANDAEDAFQATFLVLVRKAEAIARPDLVANWLYGVAYRTALEAKGRQARRRALERQVMDLPAASSCPDWAAADIRPVLDEEVNWLPEKYRTPFVLCYLEGRTTAEAARLVGCPQGTVFSRLSWARERLRGRLTRRGLAIPAGLLTTLLARDAAGVSPPSASDTVRAALALAAHGTLTGVVSVNVDSLSQGVIRAMLIAKMRFAAAAVVGVSLITVAVGVLAMAADRGLTDQPRTLPPANDVLLAAVAERDDPERITVNSLPPVVVRTVPQAGDTQVDAAAVKEVRVSYSKDMMDENWSWSQVSDETFPKTTGKPHYEKDRRTCVLPVRLQPGKTYVLWLNSEKFGNFKDAGGRSAVPYLLVFQTKP